MRCGECGGRIFKGSYKAHIAVTEKAAPGGLDRLVSIKETVVVAIDECYLRTCAGCGSDDIVEEHERAWTRWGLSISAAVEARPKDYAKAARLHNLVAGYLDDHPEAGARFWDPSKVSERPEGWLTYSEIARLAEDAARVKAVVAAREESKRGQQT